MKWGHKIGADNSPNGTMEVNRADYNAQLGPMDPTPEKPIVPEVGAHALRVFWELDSLRAPGFESLAPITPRDVLAWCEVTGGRLLTEEVRWIFRIDDEWRKTVAEERHGKMEREKERAEINQRLGGR